MNGEEPHKKSFIAFIIILIAIGVFVALYYYTGFFKREETTIPVAGITSARGTIISIAPENNSFNAQMNLLVRHENGIPVYELQTKKINVSDTAQTFNPKGKITKEDFFQEADIGDTVYIAAEDILNGPSIDAHFLIIDFNELGEEE